MKTIILFLFIICLLINYSTLSQTKYTGKPEVYYEIKIGGEINRIVPSFGIGKNFYLTKYVSLAPELIVIGAPVLGGTFRINIPIMKSFKLSPEAGFGLTPVGFPMSAVGILGLNISYKLNNHVSIFIEPRIYYYHEKIISIGSGFFGIDDLNKNKPLVITVGVGL